MLSTDPQQLDLFLSEEYIEKQRECIQIPTPHYDKLLATLNNSKLPKSDYARVERAIERYHQWIQALRNVREDTSLEIITYNMVEFLNEYKTCIDLDLIFDSPNDFLYRQKGQLKLDNTIVDEFLLQLVYKTMYKELLLHGLKAGPINHYCSMSFSTGLKNKKERLDIKTKSQGFALSKTLYIQSSFDPYFPSATVSEINLAYIIGEFKTNLDKTMFQEACATSHQVKSSVSGAKYFLLCEWLDMIPTNTSLTDIDEVLVLRKAKRLPAQIRKSFSSYEGRMEKRDKYKEFLEENPFRYDVFKRLVLHMKESLTGEVSEEDNVLEKGFF